MKNNNTTNQKSIFVKCIEDVAVGVASSVAVGVAIGGAMAVLNIDAPILVVMTSGVIGGLAAGAEFLPTETKLTVASFAGAGTAVYTLVMLGWAVSEDMHVRDAMLDFAIIGAGIGLLSGAAAAAVDLVGGVAGAVSNLYYGEN